jgi:catechol 2,3-dioxygenase-like lactoylglutathione lyase family enzyme
MSTIHYPLSTIHQTVIHHISIRTADIHKSLAFYECLGFIVSERFTTGYTLACWLEGLGGRIELIQIPEPKAAPDAFGDEHYVGYYHISFDLTDRTPNLTAWLKDFTVTLQAAGQPAPTILLMPAQQNIGATIYEVTFIADPDGLPLEFIHSGKSA